MACGTVYTLKFRGKWKLFQCSFHLLFTGVKGGGDYKSIIHLLVQLLDGRPCDSNKAAFCIYCKGRRYCSLKEHENEHLKNYDCTNADCCARSKIEHAGYFERRTDIRTLFGIAIIDIIFDISPHASLRITGLRHITTSALFFSRMFFCIEHLLRDFLLIAFSYGAADQLRKCASVLRYN